MGFVTIGVDVGQRVDPTAIAVAEETGTTPAGAAYSIRHLQRLTLGTSYPDVAERIAAVCGGVREQLVHAYQELRGAGPYFRRVHDRQEVQRLAATDIWVIVDATGVGLPVVDLIRTPLQALGIKVTAAFFTYGDRATIARGGREASVGKAYLVSRLQSLIQAVPTRIQLPKTAETEVLARELQDYEIRVDKDANDHYGAFKVGTHDDLVTALGLAVICEPKHYDPPGCVPYA